MSEEGMGTGSKSLARMRSACFIIHSSAARSPFRGTGSRSGAPQSPKIVRDHTEPDPSLHPGEPSIAAAKESVTTLEHTDSAFGAGAPSQCRPNTPRAAFSALSRQHDVAGPAFVRRLDVRARREARAGDGQRRQSTEELFMPIQRWNPQGTVGDPARTDLVISDALPFSFLNLDDLAELCGLRGLALADYLGVRLEHTEHLVRKPRVALQHTGARLRQHALDQITGGAQPVTESSPPRAGSRRKSLGDPLRLPEYGAGDAHHFLVELFDSGLALGACLGARAHAGGPAMMDDLKDASRDTARAITHMVPRAAQPLAELLHRAGEDAHAIREQGAVRRVVDVGLHDRCVHAHPLAPDDAPFPADRHQALEHLLEYGPIQQMRKADERLGVRDALAVDPAEGAIHEAAAYFALTLVEAPVVEMFEHEDPEHDRRRCAEPSASLAQRMPCRERSGDPIDEDLSIEDRVDLPESRIPELVAVGQEHFQETALPVRSPHHGASGEARRPQGLHRVSCAAARRRRHRRSRCSLTVAHDRDVRQRISARSDQSRTQHPARIRGAD